MSSWTSLGGVTEVLPGQFRFTDPQAANGGPRFYRVRSSPSRIGSCHWPCVNSYRLRLGVNLSFASVALSSALTDLQSFQRREGLAPGRVQPS